MFCLGPRNGGLTLSASKQSNAPAPSFLRALRARTAIGMFIYLRTLRTGTSYGMRAACGLGRGLHCRRSILFTHRSTETLLVRLSNSRLAVAHAHVRLRRGRRLHRKGHCLQVCPSSDTVTRMNSALCRRSARLKMHMTCDMSPPKIARCLNEGSTKMWPDA